MIEGIHHDALAGYVADEHIDWTDATDDFETTGHAVIGDYAAQNKVTIHETGAANCLVYQQAADKDYVVAWYFKNTESINTWWQGMRADAEDHNYKMYFHNGSSWSNAVFEVRGSHVAADVGKIFFPYAYGDGVAADIDLVMEDTGQIGYASSAATLKENVVDLPEADSGKIHNLRPVKYNRISRPGKDEIGLIAEEADVADIPGLIVYESSRTNPSTSTDGMPIDKQGRVIDKNGQPMNDSVLVKTDKPVGINKSRLIVPMLKEIQKLRAEVDALKQGK